jgi:tRNA A-37 threonylcarbamoyl transferase component Bud32
VVRHPGRIRSMVAQPTFTGPMRTDILTLPWHLALQEWPDEVLVALPRGISRHIVRFVQMGDDIAAVKETTLEMANREFAMLRELRKRDVPTVKPIAVVTDRVDDNGEPLPTALVTKHLRFSMPYRAVFSQTLRPDTATRFVDAMAVLLVRLHLIGFVWGDVSLSNVLFRRDAGSFAAYLVDAETGELFDGELSAGNRANDIEVARVNIAGELLDLQAGGRLDPSIDPVELANKFVASYEALWSELTEWQTIESTETWRIAERVERLNALGFDLGEISLKTDLPGSEVRIKPKVVDAGHHARRLMRLTGIDAEENQARRLLNAMDEYIARKSAGKSFDESRLAHEWLTTEFEPIIESVPEELRGKLDPPQIFHEVLEHKWYLAKARGADVGLAEAAELYFADVLQHRRDEEVIVAPPTVTIALPVITDWRDLV